MDSYVKDQNLGPDHVDRAIFDHGQSNDPLDLGRPVAGLEVVEEGVTVGKKDNVDIAGVLPVLTNNDLVLLLLVERVENFLRLLEHPAPQEVPW